MHVDVQELSVPRPRNIMLALLAVTIYPMQTVDMVIISCIYI